MDAYSEFHFLRPLWLLALAALLPLVWVGIRSRRSVGAWRAVCDAHLLRHLVDPGDGRARRWPLALAATAWTATCIGLAGPAWERLPVPAFRSPAQHVIVLNLSQSMNATDVAPSRVARARFELSDALEAVGEGQVGLVIFAEEPYVVAPISDDPRVVAEFVPVLEPGLMPGRGARVDRALDEARALLEQAGATQGGIVLITDSAGDRPDDTLAAARATAAAGFEVSVLAIGTEGGGRVPGRGGARTARLDVASLEAVARAGGGRFTRVTADDRDIAAVMDLAGASPDPSTEFEATGASSDAWRDMGIAFVWLVALIAPFAFRRGWASSLAIFALVGGSLSAAPAQAELRDWLKRPDQRGADAFESGRHADAADLFEDPAWRAAALYRDGRYDEAAESLDGANDTQSLYNRGNALARAGNLEEAIAAYDQAIEGDPAHDDAAFNRELVAKLLEEQRQEEDSSGESQDAGDESESQPSEGEDSESRRNGEENDPSEADEPRAGEEESREDAQRGEDGEPADGDASERAEQPPEAAEEEAGEAEGAHSEMADQPLSERDQAVEQWLERIADDPGGLLREKLRRKYARQRYEDAIRRRNRSR